MNRRSIKACLLSLLLLSAGCGGGGSTVALDRSSAVAPASSLPGGTSQLASVQHVSPAESRANLAINAGGDSDGSWLADADYSGPTWTYTTNQRIATQSADHPAPQEIYQTQRVGQWLTYALPGFRPGSTYTVRMHFAETFFTSSRQRVFGATVNGVQAFNGLDIYQSAGGSNIALTRAASATADANGMITIRLNASVNNVSIAGIEIIAGSVAPGPAPSDAPSSHSYPIYSSYFTGNTPFHHTVNQLLAAGAHVLSSTIAQNYWNEGIANQALASSSGGTTPLYMAASGQPSYIFRCPAYGTCNASGLSVHYPSNASPQRGSDHHLNAFDPVYLHGEIDGWGGDGNSNDACNLNPGNPGSTHCSWGGFYPFNGNGLETDYSSANAAGYAFGIMDVSAGELLAGHIDHALGMEQSCLDDGAAYPARVGRASDAHCPGNLEPNATYGQLIHLKSSVDVGSLGYSYYCRIIVQALQTYGGYTADNNGGWGISLGIEDPSTYPAENNPWFTTIFPSMVAGGDGSGSGSSMRVGTCLQRIPAWDIEVIQISSNLP